ncbi:hypothetical protein JCM10449v2_002883 [Rhodotorula kratochvilovae]
MSLSFAEKCALWTTHKALCGRDTETFYYAPLTPDDVRQLNGVKHRLCSQEPPFLVFLERLANLSWHEFLEIATSPESDTPTAANLRNHLLAGAYHYLGLIAVEARRETGKLAPRPAWHEFGTAGVEISFTYVNARTEGAAPHQVPSWDEVEPWGPMNRVLRQELIVATVISAATMRKLVTPREGARLKLISQKRVLEELERAAIPQSVKDRLGAKVRASIAETEQAELPDFVAS